jgi:hypothetical protein
MMIGVAVLCVPLMRWVFGHPGFAAGQSGWQDRWGNLAALDLLLLVGFGAYLAIRHDDA